ncbi:MAG: hypothetical protein H0T73_22490, partial [Ardenticatenales bacterium]|nr:hypothetical protein [Ardenticatenales bacterium]
MAESEQQAKSESKKAAVHEKTPEIGPELGAGFDSSSLDVPLLQRALANPPAAPPEAILQLQRMVGNQSVLRMTGHSQPQRSTSRPLYAIQSKLLVGSPYDNYEQEADRVAAQVVSMPATSPETVQRYAITPLTQRQLWRHPAIHPLIQAKGDGSFEAGDPFEQRLSQSKGGGSPLPEPTRNFMEERFGA